MGEWIQLKSSDGFEFSAWRKAPEGKPRGGVVVIQEIFGVNHHIRSVVHRFAASGFVAVAPALFDRLEPHFDTGYDDASRARAFQLMGKFDRALAVEDIAAAIPTASGRRQGRRRRLLPRRPCSPGRPPPTFPESPRRSAITGTSSRPRTCSPRRRP